MKSFKVAEFNAPLAEIDEPTPQPSGTQVLIKVKAAMISDMVASPYRCGIAAYRCRGPWDTRRSARSWRSGLT